MFLKNTSGQFVYFSMINVTTGAPVTGITPTCRRCIDGTFAAATGTVTEDTGLGFYKMALSQADTNGNNIGYRFIGTGAIDTVVNIVTTSLNPYDATRFGMAALPNAAAEAAGGLLTRGTGAGQINQDANGRIDVNLLAILGTTLTETAGQIAGAFKQFFNIGSPTGTVNLCPTTTNLTNAPTNGDFTAAMKTSLNASTPASITGNVGGNVTGSVGSVVGAVGSVTGAVGSVTGNVGGNVVGTVASVVGAVASVTGNVGGNVTGSVGSVAANGITASSIATDAIGAAEIAAGAANKIADHIIRRTMTNARASSDGDAVNSRSMLGMLSLHRNKKDISGSNLVVKTEDDSTTFFTDVLSTDAAAVPIIGVDPA